MAKARQLKIKYVKRLEVIVDPAVARKFGDASDRVIEAYFQERNKNTKFVALYTLFNDPPEARITHTLKNVKAFDNADARAEAFKKLKEKGYNISLKGPPPPRAKKPKAAPKPKPPPKIKAPRKRKQSDASIGEIKTAMKRVRKKKPEQFV